MSLSDLSPLNIIPKDHLLVVLKSYFDGGNQADSRQYDRITLAAVCGTSEEWRGLESAWKDVLSTHKAPFLHTTDAIGLQKEFSKDRGWTDDKVDSLISACVEVIAQHISIPGRLFIPRSYFRNVGKPGLFPVTMTIRLDDYRRARERDPRLPVSVNEICASESLGMCFKWGKHIGAQRYELYFDQGEPFYGHVYDRRHNKKSKKDITPMSEVIHIGESDMRDVPALQVADLFAWCINHNDDVRRKWHGQLHELPWDSLRLNEEELLRSTAGALERTSAWKLPRRKPTP
jgi:hypothetical protein